jgi:transketolase
LRIFSLLGRLNISQRIALCANGSSSMKFNSDKVFPHQTLSHTPKHEPQFFVEIENSKGEKEKVADPKATRALVALMNQHAVIGGAAAHWGGPAAFAEINSALHAIMFKKSLKSDRQWFDRYHFVNDAGHAENGLYALRANYQFDDMTLDELSSFRSIKGRLTGHGEAHINPGQILISNGPLGSGAAQAQGLAMADKLLGNDRTTICTISDGACMEGEAKECFASLPGLAQKGKLNPFLMVVSYNDTKLSGRISEDSFSLRPSLDSLETLGWDVQFCEEGHDLQKVYNLLDSTLEKLEGSESKRPVCLVFKTVKGYGIKKTMESKSGGHGYPLKAYDSALPEFISEIYEGQAPSYFVEQAQKILQSKPESKNSSSSTVVKEKVQVGISKACNEMLKMGYPLYSLSSDLAGSTGIANFQKTNPENFYDLGIAESNMVGSAIGFSKAGLIPLVDTFAQFGITKGNLPLIMAGLSQGPVIALFSHIGFQDAADGASHQATTYFAATCAIPETKIISCSCSDEAYHLMKQAVEYQSQTKEKGGVPESVIFFFGRENHPQSYVPQATYKWGKTQEVKTGSDALLVTTGPMVNHALAAAEILEKEGIHLTVINNAFINRPDVKAIAKSLAANKNKLITLEDHQIDGGMGSFLASKLLTANSQFSFLPLGITGGFGQSAYQAEELYQRHSMDAAGIVNKVKSFL